MFFNGDVSQWNVSSVTNMYGMFAGASSFGQSLCWNTAASPLTTDMFEGTNGAGFSAYPTYLSD
jgi:hypothetical protein